MTLKSDMVAMTLKSSWRRSYYKVDGLLEVEMKMRLRMKIGPGIFVYM